MGNLLPVLVAFEPEAAGARRPPTPRRAAVQPAFARASSLRPTIRNGIRSPAGSRDRPGNEVDVLVHVFAVGDGVSLGRERGGRHVIRAVADHPHRPSGEVGPAVQQVATAALGDTGDAVALRTQLPETPVANAREADFVARCTGDTEHRPEPRMSRAQPKPKLWMVATTGMFRTSRVADERR